MLAISPNLPSASVFRIGPPPKQLLLQNITVEDLYAGSITNYNFTICLGLSVFASNATAWIDFPQEYKGLLSGCPKCLMTYGGLTSTICTFLKEFFGLRLQVLLPFATASNQHDVLASQVVSLRIWELPNPKQGGSTGYFTVRYVDLSTSEVKTSSFGIISPASKLLFSTGLFQPVLINSTDVVINAGTWSSPITLDMTSRSRDPVVVTLSSDNTNLFFSPPSLLFNSSVSALSFMIGASANITGTFFVSFTKYEAVTQQRFSPINSFTVVVVRAEAALEIEIDPLPSLPIGVQSMPISVRLSQPCTESFVLELYTTTPEQPTAVSITPSQIQFSTGDSIKTFTFILYVEAKPGYLGVVTRGIGAAPYKLRKSTLPFAIAEKPSSSPTVVSLKTHDIKRVSAWATVSLSAPASIFYMYSLVGTPQPDAVSLQMKTQVRSDVPRVFGSAYTGTVTSNGTYYEADVQLKGLIANSKYNFFFTYKGYDNNLEPSVRALSFRTQDSYDPAIIIITTVQYETIDDVIKAVAQSLGIHESYLHPLSSDVNILTRNRHLQTFEYQMVITTPEDEEVEAPMQLINSLITNQDLLRFYLPSLSTKPIAVTAQPYNNSSPEFIGKPRIVQASNSSLTIEAILSNGGRVYGVLTEANIPTPTSWQIVNGLDGLNRRVKVGHFQSVPCLSQIIATLKFTGLKLQHRYMLWLSGTNDLGVAPQRVSDRDLTSLNITGGRLNHGTMEPLVLYTWDDEGLYLLLALAYFLF